MFKKFPSAHTILLLISAFVAGLTWIIPSGKYSTLVYEATENVFLKDTNGQVEKLDASQQTLALLNVKIPLESFTSGAIYKPVSIPNTYQQLTPRPQGFFEFVQAPMKGIIETSDIIFLVLIIGGLVGIVEKSGAFSAGIHWLSKALIGKEFILIISTTLLVAMGGTTFGFGEEGIAFLPILIPIFIAAKYDALVAIACVFLGSQVGVMASTSNPFSTILASDAAGVTWTTGLQGRVLMLVLCITITTLFILRYAKKVKADPSNSFIFDQREHINALFKVPGVSSVPKLDTKLKLVLLIFMLCFVLMISGVIFWEWWFVEMTTVFLFGAILIGLMIRMKETQFIHSFMKGAGELLAVAFIIGIARGISILMTDGLISDTILYEAGSFTGGMGKNLFINVLFFVYNLICFFVSSTSGTAVLTIPILAPLADTVNISREVIVNAFQFGHGLFNLINPTGLILAFLGIAQIGFDRFLKFVWPLLVILALVIMLFLTISVL